MRIADHGQRQLREWVELVYHHEIGIERPIALESACRVLLMIGLIGL